MDTDVDAILSVFICVHPWLKTMRITCDWHIHSRNSCDSASLAVSDLLREAQARGIRDLGLTDHVHTPFNLADLDKSRLEFDKECVSGHFHFGVEVSCVSQWEIEQVARGAAPNPVYGIRKGGPPGGPLAVGVTDEDLKRLGVEFVVGGTHWPLYVALERESVIRDYHRQNMFLVVHPLVDIVAHPWWWHGHWRGEDGTYTERPWFDDFGCIPASMHREFAQGAMQHSKKVEINLCAMLLNRAYPERFKRQYLEYLAELKACGVSLCVGSDCHSSHYDTDFETGARMLESVGIGEGDLWVLPPRGERHGPTKASEERAATKRPGAA